MKSSFNSILFTAFFLSSCSSRIPESSQAKFMRVDPELVMLKPNKTIKSKPLSTLYAELFDSEGKLVNKKSGPLGDCKKCFRGASAKECLGITLEGNDLNALKILFKSSPYIELTDCGQDKFIEGHLRCDFQINDNLYSLRLSLKQ